MAVGEILVGGVIAAVAVLFLLFKFGDIQKVLAFDIWIDLGTTALLSLLMAGTFSGIMIALTAGAIISVTLWAMKQIFGKAKFTFHGFKPSSEAPLPRLINIIRKRMKQRRMRRHAHKIVMARLSEKQIE